MIFQGITADRQLIILDERVYSNAELDKPLAPSDTVKKFLEFLEKNQKEWGLARDVFIDSADQATITELRKYKRLHGCIHNFWMPTRLLRLWTVLNCSWAGCSRGAIWW